VREREGWQPSNLRAACVSASFVTYIGLWNVLVLWTPIAAGHYWGWVPFSLPPDAVLQCEPAPIHPLAPVMFAVLCLVPSVLSHRLHRLVFRCCHEVPLTRVTPRSTVLLDCILEGAYLAWIILAIAMSSPLFVTIGTVLAIPASAFMDYMLHGISCPALSFIGTGIIPAPARCLSVSLPTIPTIVTCSLVAENGLVLVLTIDVLVSRARHSRIYWD